MTRYVNVVDLSELQQPLRSIVSRWVDTDDIRTLEPTVVDGDYVRIVGDDATQIECRASILEDEIGVRVRTD